MKKTYLVTVFSIVSACTGKPPPPELHTSVAAQGLCGTIENECDGLESYTDENGDTYTPDCEPEMVDVTVVESCADCDDDPPPPDVCGEATDPAPAPAPTPAQLRQACLDAAEAAVTKCEDEMKHADAICQDDANKELEDCLAAHADEPVAKAGCQATFDGAQSSCFLESLAATAACEGTYAHDILACKTGIKVSVIAKPVMKFWGWIKKIGDTKPDMDAGSGEAP